VSWVLEQALRPVTRRLGWGLVDQSLMSLGNFTVGILVARSTDPRGFGVFGILFAGYTLLLGFNRSLLTEPFTIRFSTAARGPRGPRVRDAVCGGALGTGALACLGIVLLSFAFPADLRTQVWAFAVVVPGLLLQDCWRFLLLAERRPRRAVGMEVAWVTMAGSAFATLLIYGRASVATLLLAWGLTATVAVAAALLADRARPSLTNGLRWVRDNQDLSRPILVEFGVLQGAGQATVYGIPAVASLAVLGVMKGAELLLGPLNILSMGVMAVAMPELVRLRERSLVRFRSGLALFGSGMALLTIGWTVVLLLLPDAWGRALLGEIWEPARSILIAMGLLRAAGEVAQAAGRGLRILELAQRSLRIQVAVLPFYVAAVLLGAWRGGALGAVAGGAVVTWAAALLWWQQLSVAVRRLRRAGSPDPSSSDV
jgi:hypothetical protein